MSETNSNRLKRELKVAGGEVRPDAQSKTVSTSAHTREEIVRIMLLFSDDECQEFATFASLPIRFERLRQSLLRDGKASLYDDILTQLRQLVNENNHYGLGGLVIRVVELDNVYSVRIEPFFQGTAHSGPSDTLAEETKHVPDG